MMPRSFHVAFSVLDRRPHRPVSMSVTRPRLQVRLFVWRRSNCRRVLDAPNTPEGIRAMAKIAVRSIVALTAAAVLIAGAAVANADPADIPPMQTASGDYVGDWQRHLSTMTIAPDGTGTILLGSSARDGEKWTMRWTQGDGLGLAINFEQRIGAWGDGLDGNINEQTAWKAELVVAPDGVTVLHLAHNDAELTDAQTGDIWCSQKYGYSRFCGA
jgi:hypothetical protein